MSQTRFGRPVKNPIMRSEINAIEDRVRQKLKGVWLLLFYYQDQRPGVMDILLASIQMPLDQRDGIKVRQFTEN